MQVAKQKSTRKIVYNWVAHDGCSGTFSLDYKTNTATFTTTDVQRTYFDHGHVLEKIMSINQAELIIGRFVRERLTGRITTILARLESRDATPNRSLYETSNSKAQQA